MSNENSLLSVGIDIGTTTTHLVVTRLRFSNVARPTQIKKLCISDREVLFESPVYETPLAQEGHIDANAVGALIKRSYEEAAQKGGIDMAQIQTGAVIITGETASKRNAPAVLAAVAKFAGEFVVESAGPGLESILCARGSGAQALSKETGINVLSLDIGGGTSNFAWIKQGKILDTAALAIGGRALRFDNDKITHMSESASLLCQKFGLNLTCGLLIDECQDQLQALANHAAEIIVGICLNADEQTGTDQKQQQIQKDARAAQRQVNLWLTEVLDLDSPPDLLFISGGVAALMEKEAAANVDDLVDNNPHKDFGLYLARALIQALKARHNLDFFLAPNAIRATVLGAGMHTLQLTGSTIDFDSAINLLPLRNIPLIRIDAGDGENLVANIRKALALKQLDWSKQVVLLSLNGLRRNQLQYQRMKLLAGDLASAFAQLKGAEPLVVAADQDIAMALGLLLKRSLADKRIISVDGIVVQDGDYVDIGKPVHSNSFTDRYTETLPVVVKTLIFYKN